MKHVVEMGSGAMMYTYIQSFIKTDRGIHKLTGGRRCTDSMVFS
jgi:hypothetical protein